MSASQTGLVGPEYGSDEELCAKKMLVRSLEQPSLLFTGDDNAHALETSSHAIFRLKKAFMNRVSHQTYSFSLLSLSFEYDHEYDHPTGQTE